MLAQQKAKWFLYRCWGLQVKNQTWPVIPVGATKGYVRSEPPLGPKAMGKGSRWHDN